MMEDNSARDPIYTSSHELIRPEGDDGFLRLVYSQLTPLVSSAVQEQMDEIETLEAENEQLREPNSELEDRLATVEAELGIDATASQQGVADD